MSKELKKEVLFLRKENSILHDKNMLLHEEIATIKANYEQALEAFKAAQRARFGRKSERFVDESGIQQGLFDAVETTENTEQPKPDPNDVEEITYKRAKQGKKQWDTTGIPHQEVIIPVEETQRICGCCNAEKAVIGYESSQRLNYQPAVFEIITEKREKRACRNGCEGGVVTAPLRPRVLPKCKATESLLAYICVSKVLDRQPLYHLEKAIEKRYQWRLSRQTMARWMIQMADKLQPLVNLMKDVVLSYDVAAIDATPLQVLNEPGRAPHLKSYAYCVRGGPPDKSVSLYEYNAYTQSEYVDETLTDFKGILQCDASPIFNRIGKQADVRLSYCHAHARRKFEQIEKSAKKGKAPLATEAMHLYRRLYEVEREAKDKNMTSEQRHTLRQSKNRPILDEYRDWLLRNQQKTLPKSPIGQAIAYALTHWDGLSVYMTDGRVEIDNNATERDIKPFVMARKNFLFACTQAGADALGIHFSLIITAQHHGLNPMAYYTEVLKRVPICETMEHYEALLPWNFKG
jgi:transposase